MDDKVLPLHVLLDTVGDFLAEGRSVRFVPDGRSMLPFIRGGRDSVVLVGAGRSLEVGDIVLAQIHKEYVLHRIWALDGDAVTLMGDGNLRQREACGRSEVLGVVTEIVRPGGRRVKPGRGTLWRKLLPVRPLLLALLKRTVYRQDFRSP